MLYMFIKFDAVGLNYITNPMKWALLFSFTSTAVVATPCATLFWKGALTVVAHCVCSWAAEFQAVFYGGQTRPSEVYRWH